MDKLVMQIIVGVICLMVLCLTFKYDMQKVYTFKVVSVMIDKITISRNINNMQYTWDIPITTAEYSIGKEVRANQISNFRPKNLILFNKLDKTIDSYRLGNLL